MLARARHALHMGASCPDPNAGLSPNRPQIITIIIVVAALLLLLLLLLLLPPNQPKLSKDVDVPLCISVSARCIFSLPFLSSLSSVVFF